MQYPKQIMSANELAELGFSQRLLEKWARIPGQGFARRTSNSKRSKWLFDTEKFEKWRLEIGKS